MTLSRLMLDYLPGVLAFVAGLGLAGMAIRFTTAIGWLDSPNQRKLHQGRVPLAGGLTVLLSTLFALLICDLWRAPGWQFWAAGLMVFGIAFVDDRFPIRARYRFGVQLLASCLICLSAGVVLRSVGNPFGFFEIPLGVFAVPFTILGMSALTNAINMMDGVDGLAGGIVASALFWLVLVFAFTGMDLAAQGEVAEQARDSSRALSVLIGAVLAFLVFNQRAPWRAKAAMFLGDGGSMMLGFLISSFAVYAACGFGSYSISPIAVGWIVGLPLVDLFSCVLRRLLIGATPMTPDRRHLHHLALEIGRSTPRTVFVLQLLSFLFGLVGVAGWRLGVPEPVLGWGLLTVFAIYFLASWDYWRRQDRKERAMAVQASSPTSAFPAAGGLPAGVYGKGAGTGSTGSGAPDKRQLNDIGSYTAR